MEIIFSKHPGCHERHLQRRYNNPLFSVPELAITQQQVTAAQQEDEQEARRFIQETHALLQEAAQLQGQVDTEVILEIKEKIDRLYQLGAGLGQECSKEKMGLRKLNEIVMNEIRKAAEGDTLAMQELDKEQAAYELHVQLLEYPLVAHLLREDTPVGEEELLPTLLSESEETIRVLMTLFRPEEREALCRQAHALQEQLQQEGRLPDFLRERIAAMEAPVQ